MKRTIKLIALAAVLAVFAAPALAQSKECNDENKAAWYDTVLKNYKGDAPAQKVAYDAAKSYLTCSPDDTSDIGKWLQNFVNKYEAANLAASNKNKLQDLYSKKNYAEAVSVGKQVVQSEPDFVTGYVIIALSGYNATTAGNTSLLPDAEQAANKALEMVEAGKPFAPFASKDSAVGWLNYIIGKAKVKNSPGDSIPFILKGARLDNDLRKAAGLYLDLAQAYGDGPLAKLAEAYKTRFTGKDESPESKLALANIYQMMDRQIDALARAVALSTGNDKNTYMAALTDVYKDRNKSDAGLNELVASILSKPLPDMPTPLTSLPATTPSSTPANNGAVGTNLNGSTVNGSAKPAPSPTPANKKPH